MVAWMRKALPVVLLLAVLAFAGCSLPRQDNNGQAPEKIVLNIGEGEFNPVKIYQEDAPGVVTVFALGPQSAQGSGFLVSSDGEVVTNAHVVTAETRGKPSKDIYVEFKDRQRVPATLLALDLDSDLAVLKTTPPDDVKPLELSKRNTLLPGEPVAAIGSPFGQSQSLSTGIISAIDRTVRSLTNFSIDNAIQTDASINPGNSGGPLLDSSGQVIGINQQIQTQSGGNDGVGYAIPVSALDHILDAARNGGEVRYAYLGVYTQSVWPSLGERLGGPDYGALIVDVAKGGPAAEAGLRGGSKKFIFQGEQVVSGGDVIVAIGGKRISSAADLSEIVDSYQPGDKVEIRFVRDGKETSKEVTLAERP